MRKHYTAVCSSKKISKRPLRRVIASDSDDYFVQDLDPITDEYEIWWKRRRIQQLRDEFPEVYEKYRDKLRSMSAQDIGVLLYDSIDERYGDDEYAPNDDEYSETFDFIDDHVIDVVEEINDSDLGGTLHEDDFKDACVARMVELLEDAGYTCGNAEFNYMADVFDDYGYE